MTVMMRDMRAEEKPREKFAASPGRATIIDLVAILLRTGMKGCSVMELARKVVDELEEGRYLKGYDSLEWHDLLDIPGIGKDKAVTICAAIELGRRLTGSYEKRQLENFNEPGRVSDFFMERLRHESQEHFFACYVNVKNRLLAEREITIGDMKGVTVDVKEILRWGIRYKAHGMILVHNHPSGYPEPSPEDEAVTRKLAAGASTLDLQVLDHIIIGDGVYVSLHERGIV